MRKWWIAALAVLIAAGAAAGVLFRQQRTVAENLAKAYELNDQWGVLPDGEWSDQEAIQRAIDDYDARWNQLRIGKHPYASTPDDWQIYAHGGRYDVAATLGGWSMDWSPLFVLNHVAKATVRSDAVWVEQKDDGSYQITACVSLDEIQAKMAREDGVWKVEEERNNGDAWMLKSYVLTDAQSAAALLDEWGDQMNAAQKIALQNAAAITEQPYETLDAAVQAAREIHIDAFCPLRHRQRGQPFIFLRIDPESSAWQYPQCFDPAP